MLPVMCATISSRVGLGLAARSSAAFMIWPDWQYPHCGVSSTTHAFCNGCEELGDKPSMVTTLAPSAAETGVEQERTALPLRCTVHAPQKPAPQPYFVPVRPTWSRMTHRSGVFGSASTETRLSFSVKATMCPPLCLPVSSMNGAAGDLCPTPALATL